MIQQGPTALHKGVDGVQRIRGEGEIGEGGAGRGWTAVDGGGPECIEGGRLLVDGA